MTAAPTRPETPAGARRISLDLDLDLDLDMASAICPNCQLLLVEAASNAPLPVAGFHANY